MAEYKPKLPWSDDIDDNHYQDALDYLTLHWTPDRAKACCDRLRSAKIVKFLPSDLLRAASLLPRPLDELGVIQEIRRAINDGHFQPLLCVNLPHGVVIADGYHRLSAAYHLAPFRKVPLKLSSEQEMPADAQGFRPAI